MSINGLSLRAGEIEKSIMDPDPEVDQSQNLIEWSLAEYLSFQKIWFKSVNNFLRYNGN